VLKGNDPRARRRRASRQAAALAVSALFACIVPGIRGARAEGLIGDQGKLLLTSGFSNLEGVGGGGLVPLAFITGYGSSDSWGANVHFTDIQLPDYRLYTYGVAAGLFDRIELSYARQHLDITGIAIDGLKVNQDVFALIRLC
jgi:hypothetical protein